MIKEAIAKLIINESLPRAEAAAAMTNITSGEATERCGKVSGKGVSPILYTSLTWRAAGVGSARDL